MDVLLKSKIVQVELHSHRVQLAKLKTVYEFVLNQVFSVYKNKQPLSNSAIFVILENFKDFAFLLDLINQIEQENVENLFLSSNFDLLFLFFSVNRGSWYY